MTKNTNQTYFILFTFFAGFLYLLFLLFTSKGTPLHDEIGHYLISRDAIHSPDHIFDIWGRTAHTLLYILPAQSGLYTARLLSLIFALLTVYFTLEVAKMLNIKLFFLVPLFLLFQPWFADLSYMCITEVPFSLIMILGIYLYLKDRHITASFIIGLLPLIRHEGIALSGLWCIYMLYKKKWLPPVAIIAPLLIYNAAFYIFQGSWPFAMYFDTAPTDIYGSGSWFHFLIRLPHPRAVGIPIMMLVTCSLIPIIKSGRLRPMFLWYFSYFALHSIIFRFGLFASGGMKLFLLPLAPSFALAAVIGLEWIVTFTLPYLKNFDSKQLTIITERNFYSTVCAICVLMTFLFIKPWPLDREGVALKQAIAWIRQENLPDNNLISTHVYFYHFFPRRVPTVTLWEKFPPLKDMPAGTIVFWDEHYSDRWDIDYNYLTSHDKTWRKLKEFEEGTVVIFQKISL